mmetsp:Transcript_2194/g.5838  ORF Transcript_2194/g.5838 Transcript_2194/m.5838 type:complete len:164 (-) Transcript_2194:227-718(-)
MASKHCALIALVLLTMNYGIAPVRGLVPCPSPDTNSRVPNKNVPRRAFLFSSTALLIPNIARARYVLNEEGDYDEVEDKDWQATWKERLDKAQSMSTDEVLKAARGAGNLDLKEGPESDASKKRRAMSACRDADLRKKAGVTEAKDCNARVLQGETAFILGAE